MSKLIFEKQSHAILEKEQKRFLLNNLVMGCIRHQAFQPRNTRSNTEMKRINPIPFRVLPCFPWLKRKV